MKKFFSQYDKVEGFYVVLSLKFEGILEFEFNLVENKFSEEK